MNRETVEMLKRLAAKETPEDASGGFNVMECSGANFDDAYSLGMTRGEVLQARQILAMEGIEL